MTDNSVTEVDGGTSFDGVLTLYMDQPMDLKSERA